MLNSDENREILIENFPKLQGDIEFKVTSSPDPNYNCIAWSFVDTKRYWWPVDLDGVYWPSADRSLDIQNLIDVFAEKGYEICDNWNFEAHLKKVALYKDANNLFTHAARQLRTGLWTSKLGVAHDISHGTPFTIENDIYGEVAVIMSTNFY